MDQTNLMLQLLIGMQTVSLQTFNALTPDDLRRILKVIEGGLHVPDETMPPTEPKG